MHVEQIIVHADANQVVPSEIGDVVLEVGLVVLRFHITIPYVIILLQDLDVPEYRYTWSALVNVCSSLTDR